MKQVLERRFIEDEALECGCDEAGRGCLAGPVFAAAVILPTSFDSTLLNDSKQLSEKRRMQLKPLIEAEALAWGIGIVSAREIDEINILQASIRAMHLAIEQLPFEPERLLIDGNRFSPYGSLEHYCIIKGDARYQSIAAASILAKCYRDEYMQQISISYPQYSWEQNKGYPSKAHREALKTHGPSPHHRLSFAGVR